MVLLGRIELPTSPLPRVRSTTELQQQDHRKAIRGEMPAGLMGPHRRGALLAGAWHVVKRSVSLTRRLADWRQRCHRVAMSEKQDNSGARPAESREERLARQLRENLRRRKAQARAMKPADEKSLRQDD